MILKKTGYFVLTFFIGTATAFAQSDSSALRKEQPPVPVEEIIKKFSEKERDFKNARGNYVYRQDVRVQTLNATDRVTGEYHITSDILFDDKGRRTERIVHAPASTLKDIQLTPQDLQDIREIQPFVLTSDDIQKYKLTYQGKEKIDEIDTYVFDVEPRVLEKNQRYFQGRIWVDDQDMQIVKTYGKAVPDIRGKNGEENLFPRFETYREQIDEYWFPTYTRAVDTLEFSSGAQRIRQVIKYENYRKFTADVKFTVIDEADEKAGKAGKAGTAPPPGKAPPLDPKLDEKTKKKP